MPFYSGQPLTSRMKQQQNGRLLILNYLELSDAANYSCTATNLYGQDAITYQLLVKRKLTIYLPLAKSRQLDLYFLCY